MCLFYCLYFECSYPLPFQPLWLHLMETNHYNTQAEEAAAAEEEEAAVEDEAEVEEEAPAEE